MKVKRLFNYDDLIIIHTDVTDKLLIKLSFPIWNIETEWFESSYRISTSLHEIMRRITTASSVSFQRILKDYNRVSNKKLIVRYISHKSRIDSFVAIQFDDKIYIVEDKKPTEAQKHTPQVKPEDRFKVGSLEVPEFDFPCDHTRIDATGSTSRCLDCGQFVKLKAQSND